MAWTVPPEVRAALSAQDRPVAVYFAAKLGGVWVDYSYLVEDWSVDRTPSESPEQVSRFAGSIAAQASVRLNRKFRDNPDSDPKLLSTDFAVYAGGAATEFLAQDYGLGVEVSIAQKVSADGVTQWLYLFSGKVTGVSVGDDGSTTLTCTDRCSSLLAKAELPVMAVDPNSPPMPVYMVVEHLLRLGGWYRTPPAPADCVLSVSGLLPEVGDGE